jgi:hypothetical protein
VTDAAQDLPRPGAGGAPEGGPAVSLAFFDSGRGVHGTIRSGLTLIFGAGAERGAAGAPEIESGDGDSYRARLADRLELEFAPISEVARLGGARVRVCRVAGTVDGGRLECLGTVAVTLEPPRWEKLDAFRAVSALFDADHAVLAVARRPRGAPGHGYELVSAAMLAGGELRSVEEARLSTVYDGDGRQRAASAELFMPGEDFPRRLVGEVAAGTTLELPGLLANVTVFDWHMEGREGIGGYELTVRDEPPAAA